MRPFDGSFETVSLPGGVNLHLAPSDKFKTAVLKVYLRTDLAAATATDLALLPNVLRRGTRANPTLRELNRALEALFGAQLGGDVLKVGEQQILIVKLEVAGERFLPKGTRAFERSVGLLRDLVLDPALDRAGLFQDSVVTQEKEKQRQFIEGLVNDRGSYAAERCNQEMCKDEPFSIYEYGELAALEKVTPATLRDRWRDLITRAPIDLYCLGAFDERAVRDLVAAAFAIPGRDGPASLRGTTPDPAPRPARTVREPMPVKQGKLCMGLRAGTRVGDEGYFGSLVMNGVLGAFPHSKLFKNVREKAGLCYYASSSYERTKGLLFIQSGIERENFEKARDLSLEQLAAIARGEVSEEELSNTSLAFHHSYRSLLDKPAHLANAVYVMRLGGRSESIPELARRVESTTKDEVVAAAGRARLDTVYFLEPDGTAPADDDDEQEGEDE